MFAANAGSIAIQTAPQGATTLGAVLSTTHASDPVTTSSLIGVGDDGSAGRGRHQDELVVTRASSADPPMATGSGTAPAELVPVNLESLERALGQRMRQVDEIDGDLAEWFTRVGALEMLLAAGIRSLRPRPTLMAEPVCGSYGWESALGQKAKNSE